MIEEKIYEPETGLWNKNCNNAVMQPYAQITINFERDYKIFVETIEKSVAKEPIGQNLYGKTGGHIFKYVCPNCEEYIIGIRALKTIRGHGDFKAFVPKYCPECGQKFDWSELEKLYSR